MRRRVLLAAAGTAVTAGCAAALGLVDRVEIVGKRIEGIEEDGEGENRTVTIAERRYDPEEGARYEGEIREPVGADVDPGDPLVVTTVANRELADRFATVRYVVSACGRSFADGDERGCRDATLFRDDFNEVEVGDVADIKYEDGSAGVVSVHERRTNRA